MYYMLLEWKILSIFSVLNLLEMGKDSGMMHCCMQIGLKKSRIWGWDEAIFGTLYFFKQYDFTNQK